MSVDFIMFADLVFIFGKHKIIIDAYIKWLKCNVIIKGDLEKKYTFTILCHVAKVYIFLGHPLIRKGYGIVVIVIFAP